MDIFCDDCGDITKAYMPITFRFLSGEEYRINICLECWDKIKDSRKLQIAKLLEIIRG